MAIPWLSWGGDLQISPNGSLVMANGWDEIRQSIERGLLTNPSVTLPDGEIVAADYIFAPSYGAGLGLWIGQNPTQRALRQLERVIIHVVLSQPGVDSAQMPTVSFRTLQQQRGLEIDISMTLLNGQTGTVTIPVDNLGASL